MSTSHLPLTALILALGCAPTGGSKGTALADDICELSSMAWEGTFSNPCGKSEGALCYDALTVLVEPITVDLDASSADLAFCLEGEITASAFGITTTLAEAAEPGGLLDLAMGHGHLTADDGFAPRYGLTVGLVGSLDELVYFSEDSYWWKDGIDRDVPPAVRADLPQAFGQFTTDAATLDLQLPDDLATGLGLETMLALGEAPTSHWDDPACRPAADTGR